MPGLPTPSDPRSRALWLRAAVTLACALAGPLGAAQGLPEGNGERGRALLLQRFETGCVLCHTIPGLPAGGDLGPALDAVSQRYDRAGLRDKIADARRYNPQTIMPPYFSTAGLHRVAPAHVGKTVLSAQALEDVVTYLLSASAPGRPQRETTVPLQHAAP